MAGKSQLLQQHNSLLNKILNDNRNLFLDGSSTSVVYKEGRFFSKEFTTEHEIYFKSKYKDHHPSIKLEETWCKDDMVSYCYRFIVPFFEHCCACIGPSYPVKLNKFEFRYERHNFNHYPDHHMHVFDGLPPKYHVGKIDIEDFFGIIKRDFIKNCLIDFDY